jgi:hypothetical protein
MREPSHLRKIGYDSAAFDSSTVILIDQEWLYDDKIFVHMHGCTRSSSLYSARSMTLTSRRRPQSPKVCSVRREGEFCQTSGQHQTRTPCREGGFLNLVVFQFRRFSAASTFISRSLGSLMLVLLSLSIFSKYQALSGSQRKPKPTPAHQVCCQWVPRRLGQRPLV